MSRADERVANGLCPKCGKESAPYSLCYDCRQIQRLTRSLKKLVRQGHAEQVTSGRGKPSTWRVKEGMRDAPRDNRWETPIVPSETDRRFHPRLGGIPVNVEAQIYKLAESIGRPFTIDEIIRAWGNLRGEKKRKKGSAAADVRAIILAEDRRRKRAEKRLAFLGSGPSI